jgi:hypothetical protein
VTPSFPRDVRISRVRCVGEDEQQAPMITELDAIDVLGEARVELEASLAVVTPEGFKICE